MIQAYSNNITVESAQAIPFNNTQTYKGCTVAHGSPATFELNKCGVYLVEFNGSAAAAVSAQLYVNGVARPGAQATGTAVAFSDTIVVPNDNSRCNPCTSPTVVQVVNTGAAAGTFDVTNIIITKIV